MRKVSYQPTAGLSYDPEDPVYWDEGALKEETRRVFEVCHGCRMCFKYCDSFPTLFGLIDDEHDGDAHGLTAGETQSVVDACFQCKLCEVQCPYTPRDSHEFQLDFPRLVHRHQAVRARKPKKIRQRLRDRMLTDPDGAGRMARLSLGLANVLNRLAPFRWVLEKLTGIHRKKQLPPFAGSTFERWAQREGLVRSGSDSSPENTPEAVLFQTCYVQNNEPQIGRDTVEVMRENSVDLACVAGLACCGMPAWESGDLEGLRARARRNLDVLMPFVERGARVLAINPTCSMMLRREWPGLLEGNDAERASKLAEAVMDPSEFLWSLREEERFNTDFKSAPTERVAYHAPCHLRAQAVGFRGRDLMRKIPGVKPQPVMECCGHDGTYAMKVEGFEASCRIGDKAFKGMQEGQAELWVSDCPLAALQFEQHAGVKPLHPMSVLARAYRAEGFSRKLDGADRA